MGKNAAKAEQNSIKMINLKCPNCDQILEVEDELDTFYCKYCGGKIILSDEARLNAKIKIKEIEHNTTLQKLKMEKEMQENKMMMILLLVLFPLMMVFFIIWGLFLR